MGPKLSSASLRRIARLFFLDLKRLSGTKIKSIKNFLRKIKNSSSLNFKTIKKI